MNQDTIPINTSGYIETISSQINYLFKSKPYWFYYEEKDCINLTAGYICGYPIRIKLYPCTKTSESNYEKPNCYYIEYQSAVIGKNNISIVTYRYLYKDDIIYQLVHENNVLICKEIDIADIPSCLQRIIKYDNFLNT